VGKKNEISRRLGGRRWNSIRERVVSEEDEVSQRPAEASRPYRSGLIAARGLAGSLPLDLRASADGDATLRPAVMFGAQHMVVPDELAAGSDTGPAVVRQAERTDGAGPAAGGDGAGSVDAATDDEFDERVAELLGDPTAGTSAPALARAADATYDFDHYLLLRERDDPIAPDLKLPPREPARPAPRQGRGAPDAVRRPAGDPTPTLRRARLRLPRRRAGEILTAPHRVTGSGRASQGFAAGVQCGRGRPGSW